MAEDQVTLHGGLPSMGVTVLLLPIVLAQQLFSPSGWEDAFDVFFVGLVVVQCVLGARATVRLTASGLRASPSRLFRRAVTIEWADVQEVIQRDASPRCVSLVTATDRQVELPLTSFWRWRRAALQQEHLVVRDWWWAHKGDQWTPGAPFARLHAPVPPQWRYDRSAG